MSDFGFRVTSLRIVGKNVDDAIVRFEPGLNVIAGLSNTGKSYVFSCLKYMMGSKTLPKKGLKEAAPYSLVRVELGCCDGRILVLERALRKTSDIRLYNVSLDTLSNFDAASSFLSDTHSEKDPENISSFLLQAAGWNDSLRLLQKTSTNDTRPLWFHDIRPFCLVDEVAIISENTPVQPSGQYTKRTVETATFDLLISGRDWSDVRAKPKRLEIRLASWEGQQKLLGELIAPLEERLADSASKEELATDHEETEARIAVVMRELTQISNELKEINKKKRQSIEQRRPKELRTRVIEQLLHQFSLLAESYSSDVERLEFIEETANFASQLGTDNCPTCGQPIPHEAAPSPRHVSADEQIAAARAERAKLKKHLADLAETTSGLEDEQSVLADEVAQLDEQASALDTLLKSCWLEQSKPIEQTLRHENKRLAELARKEEDWKRIESLRRRVELLGPKPGRRKNGQKEDVAEIRYPTKERREFCDSLQATLAAWKVPGAGTVEFDAKMNLIINGVEANSNGKGVRAIIRSAFVITLMRYCEAKNLPHPRFVVLDSPLTSFKEADREQLGQEVQQAFYEDLAAASDSTQVVILENKEPPKHVQELVNYEYFTRNHNFGRYGFFPSPPDE